MVRFDKTFKTIMEHVRKMLDCSHFDLNRHIKATIFSETSDPSPMLKYYNELLQNTNFALPDRHLLEFDREVFRKTINKISRAHKKELEWVRNLAIYETKAHLEKKFGETSETLHLECSNLID